jgi:hypothetical protein
MRVKILPWRDSKATKSKSKTDGFSLPSTKQNREAFELQDVPNSRKFVPIVREGNHQGDEDEQVIRRFHTLKTKYCSEKSNSPNDDQVCWLKENKPTQKKLIQIFPHPSKETFLHTSCILQWTSKPQPWPKQERPKNKAKRLSANLRRRN